MTSAYLFKPSYPYQRIARLKNATNIQYAFSVGEATNFTFDLPAVDATLDAGMISPGALVGFISDRGVPDYLGWVDQVDEGYGDAYVRVTGREWAAILGERTTAQEHTYANGAAGRIASHLIRAASSRNPTGITVAPASATAAISSPFTVRSQSVLEALSELADLTGNQWEVRYQCGQVASATFFWLERAGRDLRNTVHLAGKMIAQAEYRIDAINDNAVVQIVGSSGEFRDRPSAAAQDSGALAQADTAKLAVRVPAGGTSKVIQRRGVATSRETVIRDASLPTSLAAQRRAVETLKASLYGQETISLTVSTNVDWSLVRAGNTVTVRVSGLRYGAGVVRPFRILGMQPQEDDGLCELVGTVLV